MIVVFIAAMAQWSVRQYRIMLHAVINYRINMTRAELIDYIRKNDEFYQTIDLSKRTEQELQKLKEMIDTIKEYEQREKAKSKK